MDPEQTLVNVANFIANEQYQTAKVTLETYKVWRDHKGFEPTIIVSGQDIQGDIVCKALEQTIEAKGGFAMLHPLLDTECAKIAKFVRHE